MIADLRDWQPVMPPVEVMISNAALQWVPGHRDLLPRLKDAPVPGGWLAFQVPGNFDEPSHRPCCASSLMITGTRTAHRYRGPAAFDAATYLDDLARIGRTVEAETTYLHVLTGPHPVFMDLRHGCPPSAAGATGAGAGGFRRRVPGPARRGVSRPDMARSSPSAGFVVAQWRPR